MDCIFCKIVKGSVSCYKVYEDAYFLGFLDINPRTLGHSLLIPKKHFTWVYDVENFDKYWIAAHNLTSALQKTLNPHFVTYATHGLEVAHAHIHIMPRKKEETVFVPQTFSVDPQTLSQLSTNILKNSLL